MSERRRFLKLLAAGPAGALLLPLFSETGSQTLAEEVECVAEKLGHLPKNIIFAKGAEGVWKGKAGSHVPVAEAEEDGDKIALSLTTKHGMSATHYIVRHTVVSADGQVLGGKTFSWEDQPTSTFELPSAIDGKTIFVTSFCNKHDLWIAAVKV